MARGRGGDEFVRLTSGQFSLAVAAIVLLAAGAAFIGYNYGRSTIPPAPVPPYPPLEVPAPPSAAPSSSPVAASPRPAAVPATVSQPSPSSPAVARGAGPPPAAAAAKAAVRTAGALSKVMVQVSSVRSESDATRMLASLGEMGYRGRIVPVQLSTGTWYRVQVGPLVEGAETQAAIDAIARKKGLKGFPVKPAP
jgi:DedD protein